MTWARIVSWRLVVLSSKKYASWDRNYGQFLQETGRDLKIPKLWEQGVWKSGGDGDQLELRAGDKAVRDQALSGSLKFSGVWALF